MLDTGIRAKMNQLPVIFEQRHAHDIQQRRGLAAYQFEHRLRVARRGRHLLQHLDGRGLVVDALAECDVALGQFSGAVAQLAEQAGVLHRDHRLGGEVLQQGDLPVGERAHFLAVDVNEAQHGVAFSQRHNQRGAGATQIDHGPAVGVALPVRRPLPSGRRDG